LLAGLLEDHVRETHDRIVVVLRDTREAMLEALGEACKETGSLPEVLDLPVPHGLPIFDGAAVMRLLELREPPLGFLHARIRKNALLARLRAQIAPTLSDALRFHRRCLDGWCRDFLSELGREFQVKAGPFRIRKEAMESWSSLAPEGRQALESDIRTLEAMAGAHP
jgi:hypothetical protein